MVDKLKIGTFNVNRWGSDQKRRKMFQFLHDKNFDIVCIQETHATSKVQKRWMTEWGGRIVFSNGTTASCGVCIMFKRKINVKVHYIDRDDSGRWLILDVSVNGFRYTLASIYGPNEDNTMFYVSLFQRLDSLDNEILTSFWIWSLM